MRRACGWAQLVGVVCAAGPLATTSCGSRSTLDELIIVLPREGGPPEDAAADAPEQEPDATAVDAPYDAPGLPEAGPDVFIPPNCSSPAIQYIYVFTEASHIWSLYPKTGTLTLIGALNCPSSGTPYSMAVDRKGNAYVLYGSSEIFHVSMRTLQCTKTAWVSPGAPFSTFGMGFVGDANGLTDTLYIASATGTSSLAKVDINTFAMTVVGSLGVYQPELSGALDGRLFTFYDDTGGSSAVDQVDPKSLAHLATYSFSNLPQGQGWAFGFWGGDFYLFTAPPNPPSGAVSLITRYRPSDGSQTTVATLGEEIVGAGVSTCAPQK